MRHVCLIAIALSGCHSSGTGEGLVLVRLSAAPAIHGVASFHVEARVGGRSTSVESPVGDGAGDLPPERSLGIRAPAGLGDRLELHVEARDAQGRVLAVGDGTAGLQAGAQTTLALTLTPPAVAITDGGGPFDFDHLDELPDGTTPPADLTGDAGWMTLADLVVVPDATTLPDGLAPAVDQATVPHDLKGIDLDFGMVVIDQASPPDQSTSPPDQSTSPPDQTILPDLKAPLTDLALVPDQIPSSDLTTFVVDAGVVPDLATSPPDLGVVCDVSTNAGCDGAHYCAGGNSCLPRLPDGASCGAPFQCSSGRCTVTGGAPAQVCSALDCALRCQVVTLDGAACVAAAAGSDPKGECAVDVPTCKLESCNGAVGAAACDAPSGASCGVPSCTGGVQKDLVCSGGGCTSVQSSCNGFSCGAMSCVTSCNTATNGGCAAGRYCLGGTSCPTQIANGSGCASDGQCQSGRCATKQDGSRVCASVACAQRCEVLAPSGTSCVAALPNTDPKNECTLDTAACKADLCNGAVGSTACTARDGTICVPSTCTGGAETGSWCQGGVCSQSTTSCWQYSCAPTYCNYFCTARGPSTSCSANNCCNGSECVPTGLATSCGDSCADCTASAFNKACDTLSFPYSCGCNSNSDCGAAKPTCNTTTHRCG